MKKIEQAPYFQYPIVKLRHRTTTKKKLRTHKTYDALYDPIIREVNLIESEGNLVKI